MRERNHRHYLSFIWLPSAGFMLGCASHGPPAAVTEFPRLPAPASIRVAGTPTVQSDPSYREAERLYRARDFTGAQQIVDRLLAAPDISTPNRDFLLRQKAILRRGVTARSPANSQLSGSLDAALLRASRALNSQLPPGDCGPRALAIACKKLGVNTDLAHLTQLAGTTDRGTSLEGLASAARAVGLTAEGVQVNRLAFSDTKTPAVIWLNGGHFAVLLSVTVNVARIHDPNNPREEAVSTDELFKRSGGILLKLSRK